jgi:signal transduction histidine kinase
MSHEIRTPLNAIIGFARVLERDMTLSEKQAEQIRTITRSSEHLLTLVNQTLDYSRIEAGAETVNPTRFRIRRLVDDVLHMFRPKANRIGLHFQSNVAQEVPEFILADEAKIRQVLVNLLSNALKVTEKGAGDRPVGCAQHPWTAGTRRADGRPVSTPHAVGGRIPGRAASTRNDRLTAVF